MRELKFFFPFVAMVLLLATCASEKEKKFTLLSPDHTGVNFENPVVNTPEFNTLNYLYFYDGGGIAAGDINNDGLPDLFLVGNDTKNRLYLNKGNFQFDDITETAGVGGVAGSWSTGVTMADVNGDSYLDIYVSQVNYLNKSGANQLFINNGDGAFTEKAADYNLDFIGYSTQAAFFDYDLDGDLDMVLLNHSFHSDSTFGQADELRKVQNPKAGDRLFRNDGKTFTDVTNEAGIYSSALGYGLGVAISDLNKNGLPDIYIGNDFHEDDYLYLNNGDGTFAEALYSAVEHTSASSMGNDIADINNDGYVDIISVDMMPEDNETYMKSSGPDLYKLYQAKRDHGFGHKNARNTLQLNQGLDPEGTPFFSEIAFASGVAKTDWSWASLFADLDNDGMKDLFVTNGIVRRSNDLNFLREFYRKIDEGQEMRTQLEHVTEEMMELIPTIPEGKATNYTFRNNDDLAFTDTGDVWGLTQSSFSNGAVYVDLNNDGHLDLVVNNINEQAFIYRNDTSEEGTANYLKVQLNSSGMNTSGIGSKVILYQDEQIYYQEQMPTRGFQSSVDHILHFGIGDVAEIDSLIVVWPDRSHQKIDNLDANQLIQLNQEEASGQFDYSRLHRSWSDAEFKNVTDDIKLEYTHQENEFNDFTNEPLLPYKLSTQGPALAVGDVNGDGLDDFYIGGAKGQAGKLFLQQRDISFLATNENVFKADKAGEDVGAIFFDATGNGLLDLYVVSGGGELTEIDPDLKDRLYINEGNGQFTKTNDRLPEHYVNGSIARAADFNSDGAIDLFVGGRSVSNRYGISPGSFLLKNDGNGNFSDITGEYAPDLKNVGMVTDAHWANISNKKYPDLIIAGEWMPVQLFQNDGISLVNKTREVGLSDSEGLWQSLLVDDLNGDGLSDIVAGNFGKNSRLHASINSPLRLYVNDFYDTGQIAPVIAKQVEGNYYPFEQLDELLQQFYAQNAVDYREYASKTVLDLFGRDAIESSLVKEVKELGSFVFMNNGNGSFIKKKLPIEAQLSPVMAIYTVESGQSSYKDILLAGNLYEVKPSIGGRQDANYGLHLSMDGEGSYQSMSLQESGFYVQGEVREIKQIKTTNGNLIIVVRNDDEVQFFRTD